MEGYYDGGAIPFKYPYMTWDDFFEINKLIHSLEKTERLEDLLAFRLQGEMLPVKQRTKEYVIEFIKGTQN